VKNKEKQIEEMEQFLVQEIVCSKSWKPRDIIERLSKMIIPEDSIVVSKEEYEKLQTDMRRLAYQNCNLTIENKNLKEDLDIEILKGKETAEKFIKECKKYKVKKFSPVGIEQRDAGVSWIEMPEWKFDELAKQFGVEIKEN
jgi:regulator of replication initiation timing